MGSFDGHWNRGFIFGSVVTWHDGTTSTLTISGAHIKVTLAKQLYSGILRPDGNIHWSDGDIWTRVSQVEFDKLKAVHSLQTLRAYVDEVGWNHSCVVGLIKLLCCSSS